VGKFRFEIKESSANEDSGVWCKPLLKSPIFAIAGYRITPVLGFWTLPDLHWEFLRLWTGFELSSSWPALPCYGPNLNRNILDFMSWHQIDLVAQDLDGIQRPKYFQKNSWK
jgi:hypothetical protein